MLSQLYGHITTRASKLLTQVNAASVPEWSHWSHYNVPPTQAEQPVSLPTYVIMMSTWTVQIVISLSLKINSKYCKNRHWKCWQTLNNLRKKMDEWHIWGYRCATNFFQQLFFYWKFFLTNLWVCSVSMHVMWPQNPLF